MANINKSNINQTPVAVLTGTGTSRQTPDERLYDGTRGWGDSIEVESALAGGADPNFKPRGEQLWPLVRAVTINRKDIVRHLLRAGANVHLNKELALRRAVQWRDTTMVRYLLEAGADVHINGDEPLESAIHRRSLEIIRLLLTHGADPNFKDGYYFRLLVGAGEARIAKILLESGAKIHSPTGDAFLNAVQKPQMLSFLLKWGGQPVQTFSRKDARAYIDVHFDLCKALLGIADSLTDGSVLRARWLKAFQKTLNSCSPRRGRSSREYNDVLVVIHREFGLLVQGEFDHVAPASITSLML